MYTASAAGFEENVYSTVVRRLEEFVRWLVEIGTILYRNQRYSTFEKICWVLGCGIKTQWDKEQRLVSIHEPVSVRTQNA